MDSSSIGSSHQKKELSAEGVVPYPNSSESAPSPTSFDRLNTNSTETAGSLKNNVLEENFVNNSVLVNARVIDKLGKTQNRPFEELSESERIRFYAKKEVKKARKGIGGEKIFNIEELRRLEKTYLENVVGKKILLLGERMDIDNTTKRCCVFLGYNSLLHKRYVKRLLKKFHAIDDKTGVGVTLTLRCLNHRSAYQDLKKIKKCWNILRLKLRRKYYHWGGNYFLVVEVGEKNHMVHLHVILYGLYFVNQKWLSKTWYKITGDSYVVYCSKPREPKRASGYIHKYLGKSLKENGCNVNGILIIWGSGLRLWSCSRGLFEWLNTSICILSPGWEWYVYLVSSDLEGYYEVKKEDYG